MIEDSGKERSINGVWGLALNGIKMGRSREERFRKSSASLLHNNNNKVCLFIYF